MKKETRISRLIGSLDHQPAARKAYLQLAGSGLFYLLTGLFARAAFTSPDFSMSPLGVAYYVVTPLVLPVIGIVAGLRILAIGSLAGSAVIVVALVFTSGAGLAVIPWALLVTVPLIAFALQFFAIDSLRSIFGKPKALFWGGIAGSVSTGFGIALGHLFNVTLSGR